MIAFLLGLCWLVLTPVCVWLLFGRGHRRLRRVTGALTLAALQTGTMVVGFAQRPARIPAQPLAVRDARTGAPVSGEGVSGERVTGQRVTGESAAGADGPAGASPSPSATPACEPRIPTPEAVRLSFRGRALHGLTVYWPATRAQCDTATVAVHQAGHRLRIWVGEGTAGDHHDGTHSVPVRVEQGLASLSLRLSPGARHHRRYVAINGHTGDKIPLRSHVS